MSMSHLAHDEALSMEVVHIDRNVKANTLFITLHPPANRFIRPGPESLSYNYRSTLYKSLHGQRRQMEKKPSLDFHPAPFQNPEQTAIGRTRRVDTTNDIRPERCTVLRSRTCGSL